MDFHTLSRKQLQTLCKKNKIPANITNVAMADALSALNQVEGLDELLNPIEGDAGTPSVHRTDARPSTQRKAAREETEGSKVKVSTRPQRGARVAEGVAEQENKDANVPPITPAASRRRATAVSTRRKKEVEMVEEDADNNGVQGKPSNVPKTPAAAPTSRARATDRSVCTTKVETPGATSVQRAYSTRRSVRLLEKDLSKMSLIDPEDTGLVKIDDDDVSQESSNVSHQVEDSSSIEKGDSLQMESTVVSEDTQELEVCSLEKNTEYECQSRGLDSDVKLVSVTEIDMVVERHGSNEAGPEKVNCLELEAEPNASDEAGSESLPVLEESSDSSELEVENKECFGARQDNLPVEASEDIAAVTVVVPDDVSVDVTHQEVATSLPMQSECIMDDQVSNVGDDKEDKNDEQDFADLDVNYASTSLKELVERMDDQVINEGDDKEYKNLKLEGSSDTRDKSDDAGSQVLPVPEESVVVTQDILPSESSEDASMEITYQDTATLTVVVADDVFDQDVAGSLPRSPVNDASVNIKEFVDQGINKGDQGINKGDDNQDMNNETEHLNLADGNMADEDYQHPLNVDEKADDESDSMAGSEGVLELESISHSAGEHQEEWEAKPEQLEAETQKIDSLKNSGAVIEVCTESSANGKEIMEVKNVTTESSLPDVEAEDHKNTSENLEAEAQAEESEEPIAGEDIGLNTDNAFSSVLDVEAEDHKNTLENLEAEESEEPVAGADNAFSSILDGMCSPQITLVHQQVSVESAGSYIVSCPLDGELSCKSNTLVDGDVVSEDAAIANKEPRLSLETMTEESILEQKSTDIPVQSDQLKGDVHNTKMMKENVPSDDLNNKSLGELKRMLKQLTLNEKSKSKTNAVKDVEKKRTALQALPQNRMAAGEPQTDMAE